MNSTHDSKDWHISQASLQNSCLAESPSQPPPPQMQPYQPMPPMEHQYAQSYQTTMHPPPAMHHPLPSNSYLPPGKNDSDPRLPGMMALSQPGTPRPAQHTSPISKKEAVKYPTTFHPSAPPVPHPYAHPGLTRKRGRNEMFSTELGPFFSSTKPFDNLYALDRSTLLTLRIQAKMDRGFFLADNDWTCYRRNYFQVSGAFSIHGLNNNPYYHPDQQQCLVQVDGQFLPVSNFSMNISARVSNSDKKIELVQHTPKRDKGPQTTPTGKLIIPGGNLNMSSVSGANQSIVTFERIQFKTATANNGKRRAAQQYYVCLVDLYAEIEDTKQKIKIASCQSAPLVVRGRSPGHYSDNNTNHERYENNLAAPQQQPQDERFNPSTFSRPPLASPGGPPPPVMGPDYASPYYQQYSNYSHFNPMQTPPPPPPTGMMMGSAPPTPTANQHPSLPPPQTQNNYMVPSMTTSDPSSSSSSPDLYNNNEERSNIQMHVENSTEWNRSRMNSVGSNQSPATPYEQQQHSYFNNYAYDHRKYNAPNGASIQQHAS